MKTLIIQSERSTREFERPPHNSDHTACQTPNPPWWCNDTTLTANIDTAVIILIFIAIVIALFKIKSND